MQSTVTAAHRNSNLYMNYLFSYILYITLTENIMQFCVAVFLSGRIFALYSGQYCV